MNVVMPCRAASVVSLVAVLGLVEARPASAQEAREILLPRAADTNAETVAIEAPARTKESTRPAPLVGLYVSFATLQALDVAWTHGALSAGGVESNPLVAHIVESPLAFAVVKAGAGSALIYLTEKLWKKNRKAAVWTMIGINVGYGAAVAHNYRLAARQRR